MANTFTLTNDGRNAACNGLVDRIDTGTGSPNFGNLIIATAGSALALVTITLQNPAFGAAAAGVATLLGVPLTGTAATAGTAVKFYIEDSTGTPVKLADGDVTATATSPRGVMVITNTSISTSDQVQLTAMTITVPAA